MNNELEKLVELLSELNSLGERISEITGRPATIGHTGEYIASQIFDIELEESASAKGIDGRFRSGSMAGKTVNIKWYGKLEYMLDITPDFLPDYYLGIFAYPPKKVYSRLEKSCYGVIFD